MKGIGGVGERRWKGVMGREMGRKESISVTIGIGWRKPRGALEWNRDAGRHLKARLRADVQEKKSGCSTEGRKEVQIGRINKIGRVRANGKRGNKFPRVQLVGEPLDGPAEGGEGSFPVRMLKGGSHRTAERFGAC